MKANPSPASAAVQKKKKENSRPRAVCGELLILHRNQQFAIHRSNDLLSGDVQSVGELAKREGLDRRSVRRLLRLGFLSPQFVEAIAEGRQPPKLTVIALTRRLDLPLLWSGQETGARKRGVTIATSTVDS